MASATERVASVLRASGIDVTILEFPQGTRTAQDAAEAIGTTVSQIVKSIVFLADGRPVLVLASGANRVDPLKLATATDAHKVRLAKADEVRRITGFAIGGVPPAGHTTPLPVFIDQDLLGFDVVYAAAGTPTAVFAISPQQLQEMTSAMTINLHDR